MDELEQGQQTETQENQEGQAQESGGLLGESQQQDNWLPEKFAVKGNDGHLDINASAKKLAEGYTNLEKLVGSGEKPPKTPEEYQIKLDESVQFDAETFEQMKKDPQMQSFLKGAHAKGLTNEQVNYVLSQYIPQAQAIAEGTQGLDLDSAKAELTQLWGNNFDQNIQYANAAFKAFVPEKYQDRVSSIKDPLLVAILSNVGREMQEDSPAGGVAAAIAENVDDLMHSEAYFNASHPDHKKVSEQVKKYFERKHGTKPA